MLSNLLALSIITALAYALALILSLYQYQHPCQRQRPHPIPYRDCWPAFILIWFSLATLAIAVGWLHDLPN